MTIISKEIYELPDDQRFIRISSAIDDRDDERIFEGDKVSIVLPTYNEKKNLLLLVPVIEEIFQKFKINGNIIVVDDNSIDETALVALRFAKAFRNITVIQRPGKLGLGSAYRIGFKYALDHGSKFIFEMDADLSHRPSYIPKFLKCAKKYEAGLVIGSRYCGKGSTRDWPLKRKLISFSANLLTRVALRIKQTRDITSGFRAYNAETLRAIKYDMLTTNGYAWQIETLHRTKQAKMKIKEIPIIFHNREMGKSKLGPDDVKEFIIFLVKAAFNKFASIFSVLRH
ncbi:glycosyltransferase [Candidatus Bathyarchaeota archaeon]|nr:glycosyltransferase [Candidatus Bathyarchaeota archaeon]